MYEKRKHIVNYIHPSILTVLFSLLLIQNSFSQWEPDFRLTNNPGNSYTSFNNGRCIGTSGDTVYVVWEDSRDGNPEIYYKRSTDAGITWGTDIRVTNNPGTSRLPVIAVDGPVVHVIWFDNSVGNYELFYRRSTDAGFSWQEIIRLTDNPGLSEFPSVYLSGAYIHVVWDDARNTNHEIYYKRSTDSGLSWSLDRRLTNNAALSASPSICGNNSYIYIVWYDTRSGNDEIYLKESINYGDIWGPDVRLTNNQASSYFPSISASGSYVHVAWYDNRDGDWEIYYKRSTNDGESWSPDTRLTNNAGESFYPLIAASGNAVHLTWFDQSESYRQIFYNISTDNGATWGNDQKLTQQVNSDAHNPSFAFSGKVVHLIWYDHRDGDYEVYYKRNPTGNPIGVQQISSDIPKDFSLGQNYPNPFNPSTNIEFSVPKTSGVQMIVYDIRGSSVQTLVNEELKAGIYKVSFDGGGLASGVYFYRLVTQDKIFANKMIILK